MRKLTEKLHAASYFFFFIISILPLKKRLESERPTSLAASEICVWCSPIWDIFVASKGAGHALVPLSCFRRPVLFIFFLLRMRHIFTATVSEVFVVKVGGFEKCSLYVDAASMVSIGKS